MALVVGLDIGTTTVTGAVFSGSAKKFRMVDFFVEEIPKVSSVAAPAPESDASDGDGDGGLAAPLGIEQILENVLSERDLKSADVFCAVDTKDCVIREFVVPFTRDDQIRKTIFFEAEGHFTGLNLDDAVLEYLKVSEMQGKSRLLAWALRNEIIEKRLELIKSAGVDPVALDLDAAAAFNAFALTPAFDPQRTTLLVDMGTTSTKILLVEGGELKKVRALRLEAAVTGPERLIPQPAGVVAGDPEERGAAPASSVIESSIEARFREMENALGSLAPVSSGDGGGVFPLELSGEPIAVLSDEDFDLLHEHLTEPAATPVSPGEEQPEVEGEEDAEPQAEATSGGNDEKNGAYEARFPGQGREEEFNYQEHLERVGLEIQRSLAAAQVSSPVELICLTGGMSSRGEARSYFSEEFGVETIQLDFGDSVDSDLPPEREVDVGRFGAVAVGLAMKAFDHDRVGLDFRKGRYRYEHRFERLTFPLLITSLLVFLFFLQATFWAFREWKEEKLRLQGYLGHGREVYEAFFDAKLPEGANAKEAAAKQIRSWATEGKGSQQFRYIDAGEAVKNLGEVMNEINRGGVHFTITDMTFYFEARKVQASGRSKRVEPKVTPSKVNLNSTHSLFQFKQAFAKSKSRYFTVSDQGSTSKRNVRDNTFTVSLTLDAKPERLRELWEGKRSSRKN